jgi:hypothetical protein
MRFQVDGTAARMTRFVRAGVQFTDVGALGNCNTSRPQRVCYLTDVAARWRMIPTPMSSEVRETFALDQLEFQFQFKRKLLSTGVSVRNSYPNVEFPESSEIALYFFSVSFTIQFDDAAYVCGLEDHWHLSV